MFQFFLAQQQNCVKLSVKIGNTNQVCGENIIFSYLGLIIRVLEGVLGIAIVVAIVIAGIQYISSAGSPDAVKSAKSRLSNAIIGLVLYLLLFGVFEILGLGNFVK